MRVAAEIMLTSEQKSELERFARGRRREARLALGHALRADLQQMVQLGRALLPRPDREPTPARRLHSAYDEESTPSPTIEKVKTR